MRRILTSPLIMLGLLVALMLGLLVALPVAAQPVPNATVSPSGETVPVPQVAIEKSPAIIPLGSAIDPETGNVVEGVMFIHYKKAPSHQRSGTKAATNSCFAYLSKGAKWKTVEPWVMNGTNSEGIDSASLFNLEDASLAKWEDAADGLVGNGV